MKKIIKIIVIIFVLFLTSGCSVNYETYIERDGSVDDKLSITIPTSLTEYYYQTPREYLDTMYKAKTQEYGLSGYTVNYDIANDYSTANLSSSYKSIKDYLNSGILKSLYSNIDVKEEKNKIVVSLSGMNNGLFSNSAYGDSELFPDEFTVTLNSKYVIEKDNSDERNKFKGTYIWKFKKGISNRNMEFTIVKRENLSASFVGRYGAYLFAIFILAFLAIGFIIYLVMKGKSDKANSL